MKPNVPSDPLPATNDGMPTDRQVARFTSLFEGYRKAFGQYSVTEQEPGTGKNVGPRHTKLEALTDNHYRQHLTGEGPGLGVIMLTESNKVWFAAADVDNYRIDLKALNQRTQTLKLPLVLCRTKSGGAHLYVFFSEPVSAELARTKVAEWVSVLNLSNRTEIFPKQSARANSTDVGSWINLPYQNVPGPTMRYAIHNDLELELDEFLDLAEQLRLTQEQLVRCQVTAPVHDELDPLFGGPPCLVTLLQQQGFPEGTRNDGMLAVGVYLKKRFGDAWEQHFPRYNQLFCRPKLDDKELDELASGLRKKDYFYRCKQQPIASACQQRACAKRQFGVGGGEEGQPVQIEALALNGLTQYTYPGEEEESLWALEISGVRLMVPTKTLLDPIAMVSKLVETGRVLPAGLSKLSKPKWHAYLEPILPRSERLDMSVRTGGLSPLWESIIEILRTARRASSAEHFAENPDLFAYQEDVRLLFTFSMIRRFLAYRSRKPVSDVTLAQTLEGYGAERRVVALAKQNRIDVWALAHPRVLNSDVTIMPDKDAF